MGYKIGRSCVTQIKTGDSTWTNWGTIREQSINRNADTVDADCRDGDGRGVNATNYGADAPIGHTVEVTQTVKLRKDDIALKKIAEQARSLGTVEAKVGDGGFGLDVNGVFQVTAFNTTQNLKELVTVEVTLSLVEYKTYT